MRVPWGRCSHFHAWPALTSCSTLWARTQLISVKRFVSNLSDMLSDFCYIVFDIVRLFPRYLSILPVDQHFVYFD